LINLEQLYLRQNRIRNFPLLEQCCSLKELDLSYNQLTNIDPDAFKNLVALTILNIRDNKLEQLSSDVKLLKKLERIDLTNNNLIK
jgi:Leucine-rich repeat (LRR) protein